MEPHPLTELDRMSKKVDKIMDSSMRGHSDDDNEQTIFDPNTQVITFTVKREVNRHDAHDMSAMEEGKGPNQSNGSVNKEQLL